MHKLSPQAKSFIILFIIAIIGTYLAVMISRDLAGEKFSTGSSGGYTSYYYGNKADKTTPATGTVLGASRFPPVEAVSTAGWKNYSDVKYSLSFQYPSDWKIKTSTEKSNGVDYYVIQLDPGSKYYNVKIYVSSSDYFALAGLPTKTDTVGGLPAMNVSNLLYGVKLGSYYFTFDNGLSTQLINQFNALVKSVKFGAGSN